VTRIQRTQAGSNIQKANKQQQAATQQAAPPGSEQ